MNRSEITSSVFPVELRTRSMPRVLDLDVLGVGFERPDEWPRERAVCVPAGQEAMQWLRMMRFELVVVNAALTNPHARTFATTLRTAWSRQKWALIGSALTADDEIVARTLGVIAVLDDLPPWKEVERLLGRPRNASKEKAMARGRPTVIGG